MPESTSFLRLTKGRTNCVANNPETILNVKFRKVFVAGGGGGEEMLISFVGSRKLAFSIDNVSKLENKAS